MFYFIVFPMDGYHYTLAHLKQMENSSDMIYRRGAPDTFDVKRLLNDLERIKNGVEDVIKLPGFDHAKGDPEEGVHLFQRATHKFVICEGLYLLLQTPQWKCVAGLFDFTVYLKADINSAINRLKIR